jgi:hypothetical protein
MRLVTFAAALLVAQIFIPMSAQARAVHAWSSDQLNSRSTLICEGIVISIQQIGATHEFDYGGMKCPEVVMLAKIHVTRVLKGKANAEIEFRYRAVEPPDVTRSSNGVVTTVTHFVADGPQHIMLAKDMKFEFFLIPAPDSHGYISVMEGDPDDTQSVSPAN